MEEAQKVILSPESFARRKSHDVGDQLEKWSNRQSESQCHVRRDESHGVDLEDKLFALRCQWSEMLGNDVMEISPDEMARLALDACVTDNSGRYDKMQHTVNTPMKSSVWL